MADLVTKLNASDLSCDHTSRKTVDVAVNKAGLAMALEGPPVLTAIKELRCNFTLLHAGPCLTFNRKWGLSQWRMTIIGVCDRGVVQPSV